MGFARRSIDMLPLEMFSFRLAGINSRRTAFPGVLTVQWKTLLTQIRLTWNSMAYIARNGAKPNGLLSICRASFDVPPEHLGLYEELLHMETDKLDMPAQPRIELNCLQVADADYREMQFNMRASYKGKEAWYQNHIFLNNFWGWIYGLKDYGFNKYLYPVDYSFDQAATGFSARIPGDDPLVLAHFEKGELEKEPVVEDLGSYSIKKNRLIYSHAGTSSTEDVSLDYGHFHVTRNTFVEQDARLPYPTRWSLLLPEGRYPASLYHGNATEVTMDALEVLETW
jgi:hypothetical protein